MDDSDCDVHTDGETTVRCALRPRPESVSLARDFAKRTLRDWRMEELYDEVSLTVSELVTNALRHCGDLPFAFESPVRVALENRGTCVLCSVTDANPGIPVQQDPDDTAESGRGLLLVDSLSSTWGWTALSKGRGKIVWALMCAGECR